MKQSTLKLLALLTIANAVNTVHIRKRDVGLAQSLSTVRNTNQDCATYPQKLIEARKLLKDDSFTGNEGIYDFHSIVAFREKIKPTNKCLKEVLDNIFDTLIPETLLCDDRAVQQFKFEFFLYFEFYHLIRKDDTHYFGAETAFSVCLTQKT